MTKLVGELEIEKMKTTSDIEERMKKLNLEELNINNNHKKDM